MKCHLLLRWLIAYFFLDDSCGFDDMLAENIAVKKL